LQVPPQPDDIRGLPTGRFVVSCGHDREKRQVLVADPFQPNPFVGQDGTYAVGIERRPASMLRGIRAVDADLWMPDPNGSRKRQKRGPSGTGRCVANPREAVTWPI
jgi:hypothetical protein